MAITDRSNSNTEIGGGGLEGRGYRHAQTVGRDQHRICDHRTIGWQPSGALRMLGLNAWTNILIIIERPCYPFGGYGIRDAPSCKMLETVAADGF